MAQDSGEAKTEAASPRRLREARQRGQVAKSAELSGALSLLCTLLCVLAMAPWAAAQIADFGLAVDRSFEALNLAAVQAMAIEVAWLMLRLSAAPLAVAAAVYLSSLWLQTGPLFSLDQVTPKLARLNPVEGLQRVLSLRSLVRFGLMLFKAMVVATAAFLVLYQTMGDAIRVIYADAGAALVVANAALMRLLLCCCGVFALLGLMDLVYQRWQTLRDLRMSPSEVRREHRDDHGDGELKSQRKGFARELLPQEHLQFVHMASLAVWDTEGRVVVLVYRPQQYPLPLCVVRGSGEFAEEVGALLQRHNVPAVIDSALLESLYAAAQSGIPIPGNRLDPVLAHLQRAAD